MSVTCHPPVDIHNLHRSLPVRGASATRVLCLPDMGDKTKQRPGLVGHRPGQERRRWVPGPRDAHFWGHLSCLQWRSLPGSLVNMGYRKHSLYVNSVHVQDLPGLSRTSVIMSVLICDEEGYTITLDVWSAPDTVSRASAPGKMSKERSKVPDPLEYRVQRQKIWGLRGT